MNNKTLSVIVIVVLIIGGALLFMGRSAAPTNVDQVDNTAEDTSNEMGETDTSDMGDDMEDNVTVKEFTVDGANFSFSPNTMRVNVGDTVRITFLNTAGVHDLKIDEFNAATAVLQAGQSETIEFVASEAGTYEYYCSIGSHRAMGMVGSLIVE